MIYYFVLFLLGLCSFYKQHNPPIKEEKGLFVFAFLGILVLGGLRFEVGADWNAYRILFESTISINDVWLAREEKLFMLFVYMIRNFWDQYSFFVFSFFLVAFLLKVYVIRRFSPDVFLSLVIYFFTVFIIYDVNGIRQGMAMGFILVSLTSILEKKPIKFLGWVVIACLFHISALIFIPFYWIAITKLSRKLVFIVLSVSIFLSIPIRIMVENSSLMNTLLALEALSHYSTYLHSDEYVKNIPILSIAVFQRLIIFFLFFLNYKKIKAPEELKRMLINGYLVSIILFVFLSFSAEYAARLSFYYKAMEIIMIPMVVISQEKLLNRLVLFFLFMGLAFFGLYRILQIPHGGLIPYQFVF